MTEGLALLAVDDERPALEDLVRMLRASPLVASVDGAASASEAVSVTSKVPSSVQVKVVPARAALPKVHVAPSSTSGPAV